MTDPKTRGALPLWSADKAQVCAHIERHRSPFKILLKTKNESLLIRKWIEHHARIVGLAGLVIFDNMSNDETVLHVYEAVRRDAMIVRFEGMHNHVHDTALFPGLYAALARSCDYFIFLDSDEFLTLVADGKHYESVDILHFLKDNDDVRLFPGTWLLNMSGSMSKFWCGTDLERLTHGVLWGKPVLRATAPLAGFLNHNTQIDKALLEPRIATNFFVRHMLLLSPRQRIMADYNKLVSRKVVHPGTPIESVAAMEITSAMDQNIQLYIREIRRLLPSIDKPVVDNAVLAPGCLEFSPGNVITYFGEAEQHLLTDFIKRPMEIAAPLLRAPP